MEYLPTASLAIFLATSILMIKRPKGINLGVVAGIGAVDSGSHRDSDRVMA